MPVPTTKMLRDVVYGLTVGSYAGREHQAIESGEISDRGGLPYMGGKFKRERLLEIARFSARRWPGDFLEIGCLGGGTTLELARLASEFSRRVIAVDPWVVGGIVKLHHYGDFLCRIAPYANIVDVIKDFSQSPDVVNYIKKQELAFVYIDGEHTNEACSTDLDTVSHCRGVIAVDDLWQVETAFIEGAMRLNRIPIYHSTLAEGYLLPPGASK